MWFGCGPNATPANAPPQGEAAGSVTQGPSNIRSFVPDTADRDAVLAEYFEDAGPIAIDWTEHVYLLANPWLGGRQPGTEGSHRAGRYIAWNFAEAGLRPAFDGEWFQPFRFQLGNEDPEITRGEMSLGSERLSPDTDFAVLGNSGSGVVTAPIRCVGYGIENGDNGFSSFAETEDLTGRIAMLFRYEPLDEQGASRWVGRRFSPHSAMREKIKACIDRGAVGIILVNPPGNRDGRRGLVPKRSSARFGVCDVPAVHLSASAASVLLAAADPQGRTLSELRAAADEGPIESADLDQAVTVTLETEVESPGLQARNIGGVLPGRGNLVDEWVVIGGHYDHLGHGYTGSRTGDEDLHPGADDNASGTAAVMVLADLLSEHYDRSDVDALRSVLFLLFDGEEAGLHGSAYFVEHPTIPLESVNAMINLDMVGRLRGGDLSITGTGTAEEFVDMVPKFIAGHPVSAQLTPGGTGPSDHTNFYHKDIPVLFFFTGLTDDYHSPRDQPHTVNPVGAATIIDIAEDFAISFVSEPEALTFASNTQGGPRQASRAKAPVRLGIAPAYGSDIETGIEVAGISEGTAAEDAGLQGGDVLLAWNGEELTGGRVLMEHLMEAHPGQVVTFTVQRGGQNIEIPITLRAP
jgi:hypothetical protein